MIRQYDTLIVVAERDFPRLSGLYSRLLSCLESKRLIFVGNKAVGEMLRELELDGTEWIDEDSIIPFGSVHECVKQRLSSILNGRDLPRGVTGWYYQQFLKMQYALTCKDAYYMTWDGDTVPCRMIHMFNDADDPFFDLKSELHTGYFETMSVLIPGLRKVIQKSFISEHMIFKTDFMKEMIAVIEANDSIEGECFWEKIINAIPPEKIQESYFSEFETYGSYCALKHTSAYALRDWHSFRLGGEFFDPDTICERDFDWLGKDFDAISFEKGHTIREDHRNLFDNPVYQEKLSSRKMLESIQDLFKGGYTEKWD